MSPERLDADVDRYRQAAAANTAPPVVPSDPLVTGATPIEQLLRVLGLAANLGDEEDNGRGADEHAEREAQTTDAADAFAAQDEDAAATMNGITGQNPSAQLAQQLPQLVAGIAGALGGALQPVAQIPQQLAQGAQQALQAGLGILSQSGADGAGLLADPLGEDVGTPLPDLAGADEFGAGGGSGEFGAGAGGAGGGFGGPAAMPGPPVPPSAGTFPSSARTFPAPSSPASHPAPAAGAGMTGVPMMPPAALGGAAGADREPKADTKRIAVPPVRNGAPVQGRINAPPADPALTRTVAGKPVASRRVMVSRNAEPRTEDPVGPP